MSEMEKKIEKIFLVLEKSLFELISLNAYFYRERILVIGSQNVKKLSRVFRYYLDRIFCTEALPD